MRWLSTIVKLLLNWLNKVHNKPMSSFYRLRDPRFLIGILLIAIGVSAGIWIVDGANNGISTYVTAKDIAAGQSLDAGNLSLAKVQVPAGIYVAKGKLKEHSFAARSLAKGELLPLSATTLQQPGTQVMVVPLAQPLPESVHVGDAIDLYFSQETSKDSTLIAAGAVVVHEAVRGQFDGITRVELAIAHDQLAAVVSALGARGTIIAATTKQ